MKRKRFKKPSASSYFVIEKYDKHEARKKMIELVRRIDSGEYKIQTINDGKPKKTIRSKV